MTSESLFLSRGTLGFFFKPGTVTPFPNTAITAGFASESSAVQRIAAALAAAAFSGLPVPPTVTVTVTVTSPDSEAQAGPAQSLT